MSQDDIKEVEKKVEGKVRSLKPDKDIHIRKIKIPCGRRSIPALVLSPKGKADNAPGVLWIHGGGYIAGMKEMVYMSRAVELVKKYEDTCSSLWYSE